MWVFCLVRLRCWVSDGVGEGKIPSIQKISNTNRNKCKQIQQCQINQKCVNGGGRDDEKMNGRKC